MKVRIDPHTLKRAVERGAAEDEIRDVIRTGLPMPARSGRLRKAKVFPFDNTRLGERYVHKRVEVVYVVEGGVAVTVTVYVFYGEWEQTDAH
ncbi:MAG: hypothetical protein HZA90_16905 [Verrucomicrobia bacterium]|nr:hypothetical protein [Verrucomicrobiota bacterium]